FILALVQGACELLPVSSSAHVIAAEKLMRLNPSSPEMTMLLVMLHTGTMFAVIAYFWKGWMRDYFSVPAKLRWFVIQITVATFCTLIVGLGLKEIIEKVFLRARPHAQIEDIFSNLPLMAVSLAAVGVLIIYSGGREAKSARHPEVETPHSIWMGLIQGFCLPFRGFSRSGATISIGLLCRLPKQKLEEFSFALAVVLTPAVVGREAWRLLKDRAWSATLSHESTVSLFAPGVVGIIFSFIAGWLALKWLSRWLEGGRWTWFGYYCLVAAAGVFVLYFATR
ncbi:MAG: undecaprenyl-diphosphate phosphatase, partial [Verrucomicrobia bacterium]|nr:undecaprenyl-diphosphate phosphatase [Verrucomicrobiota bacterium]